MSNKAKSKRLLISLAPGEERAIERAAKLESLPVATYIRRAAVFSAKAALAAHEQPDAGEKP